MQQSTGNQKILCGVHSCRHHAQGNCSLNSIRVDPVGGNKSGQPEESKCGSYHCC